jgi:hypothetical protein
VIIYPSSCGRNFSEILRVLDSLQATDKHHVHTPADWLVAAWFRALFFLFLCLKNYIQQLAWSSDRKANSVLIGYCTAQRCRKEGDKVFLQPSMTDQDAKQQYGGDVEAREMPSGKQYVLQRCSIRPNPGPEYRKQKFFKKKTRFLPGAAICAC